MRCDDWTSIDCEYSELEKYFENAQPYYIPFTSIVGNFVELTCWDIQYFPTYNGIDPLDEIECIDSKWSLPDDMRFIRCQPLICSWPPLPDFGKKVWNKCIQRDDVCVAINLGVEVNDLFENSSKPSYENHENCFCQEALSMCKPKFITSYNESFHEAAPPRNPDNYRLMFQLNEKWISWYRLWV